MTAPKTIDELYEVCSTTLRGIRISVVRGDITKVVADIIVSPAQPSLRAGGGIDGRIHRAAGPFLETELGMKYGTRDDGARGEVGKAYVSEPHNMKNRVKAIVHAIGPRYSVLEKAGSETSLYMAYTRSLGMAAGKMMEQLTVVFPCISTGSLGFPMDEAANIALVAILDWIDSTRKPRKFARIVIMMHVDPRNGIVSDANEPHYRKAFKEITEDSNLDATFGT